jgi:gliding motility-associated-like protein
MPLPAINLTNDTTVCVGGSVSLNTNAPGNNRFNWFPSMGLSATNISNPVASPQSGTKYFVTVTGANDCAVADSIFVDVLPLPAVSTMNDTSACMNDSIALIANIANANIIQWTPSNGLSNATIQNPKVSPSTSTLYTIVAGNGICSDKDSVLISVLQLPNVRANNDTVVCGNTSVQLNASGAVSYTWIPSTGLTDAAIADPVASPGTTTTYTVKGIDNTGCVNVDSVNISVNPMPQFSITPRNSSLCSGDSVSLVASGGDVYSWSPSQSLTNASSSTPKAFPLQNTIYSVSITSTVCKTTSILTSNVTVKDIPAVVVTKSNDIDCLNFESQLNATGGINYLWSPSTYISNTFISNPIVNPPVDTKYFVTASGSNGCKNQDSILVLSNISNAGSAKFEIANAFTPNNDGLNDCFSVKYWGTADAFDLSIYNRWGQIVFHSNNVNSCWDGNYRGIPQSAGTYVYIITASTKCSNGVLHKKGTLVLLR